MTHDYFQHGYQRFTVLSLNIRANGQPLTVR